MLNGLVLIGFPVATAKIVVEPVVEVIVDPSVVISSVRGLVVSAVLKLKAPGPVAPLLLEALAAPDPPAPLESAEPAALVAFAPPLAVCEYD